MQNRIGFIYSDIIKYFNDFEVILLIINIYNSNFLTSFTNYIWLFKGFKYLYNT
jgi:hypothetical protein